MNAFDTNIYIYSYDTRDPDKQLKAQSLIKNTKSIVLLWQVGCEFIAATRKLEPFGFTRDQAWKALMDMQAMSEAVILPETELWLSARDIQKQEQLQFWDALIIAACIHSGINAFYSEDIARDNKIQGLSVVNPFT